jgi:hypothetical protein
VYHALKDWDAGLKGDFPLLEGGVAAPIKQMERCLEFGAAGEVKHLLKKDILTSPLRPDRGSEPFSYRAQLPSFEEGILPF